MRLVYDWKFYVPLLATLAGVVVPIWLWRADHQARSLQLRVASQTSLEPEVPKVVSGLKLLVDGADLERPFLTVLELTNDGSRPIQAIEYEDSIQVLVSEGVRLVRTQMTDVQPEDLQPRFNSDGEKLKISPLLLNPGDLMKFAIITAGGKPTFKVRARIAGIQSIVLEDRDIRKNSLTRGEVVVRSLIGCLLQFIYASCVFALFSSQHFELTKGTLAVGILANSFGAAFVLVPLLDEFTLSISQFVTAIAALSALAIVFAGVVNWRRRREF